MYNKQLIKHLKVMVWWDIQQSRYCKLSKKCAGEFFFKSVNIWRRCGQQFDCTLLWFAVYNWQAHSNDGVLWLAVGILHHATSWRRKVIKVYSAAVSIIITLFTYTQRPIKR